MLAASWIDRLFDVLPALSGLLIVYLGWRLSVLADWRKWRLQRHVDAYRSFVVAGETAVFLAERVLRGRADRTDFDEALQEVTLAETSVAIFGTKRVADDARRLYDHLAGEVVATLDDPPESLEEALQSPLEGRQLLQTAVESIRGDLGRSAPNGDTADGA